MLTFVLSLTIFVTRSVLYRCALKNDFRAYINFSESESLPLDTQQLRYLQISDSLDAEMVQYIEQNPLPEAHLNEHEVQQDQAAGGEV